MEVVFHPERNSPLFFPVQVDVFKLENQIELFIFKEVLEWKTGSESEPLNRFKIIDKFVDTSQSHPKRKGGKKIFFIK